MIRSSLASIIAFIKMHHKATPSEGRPTKQAKLTVGDNYLQQHHWGLTRTDLPLECQWWIVSGELCFNVSRLWQLVTSQCGAQLGHLLPPAEFDWLTVTAVECSSLQSPPTPPPPPPPLPLPPLWRPPGSMREYMWSSDLVVVIFLID